MSPDKIQHAIVFLIALIMSIAVHEFGHAFVADKLGDPLPRSQGRVTLNPIPHIDLIGTIAMPLLIIFTGAPLLGWGKPVQTNPAAYRRGMRMKTGHMLVALAGPFMNLVLGFIATVALVIYYHAADRIVPQIAENIGLLIVLNLGLMLFNLIPLPPLDGGAVLRGLLPDRLGEYLDPLERYGGIILLALLATGALTVIMLPASYVIHAWLSLWGLSA